MYQVQNSYLLIPVEFAANALKTNKESVHHTFLSLKTLFNGSCHLSQETIEEIANNLLCSTRTVKRHITMLKDWNFLGYDESKEILFIRSWSRINQSLEFKCLYGVEYNTMNISDAQALFAGIFIGWLSYFKYRKKRKTGRESAQLKSQCAYPDTSSGLISEPVADRALSKILNISKSKANLLKNKALKEGYISIVETFKPLEAKIEGSIFEVKLNGDNHSFNLKKLRKAFPEHDGQIRIQNYTDILLAQPYLVTPHFIYKKSQNYNDKK